MTVRGTARRLLRRDRSSSQAADPTWVRELLSPARCALLVVDVQNDFVHPEGRIGPGRARGRYGTALAAINSLVGAARRADVPVIFIRTEHGPDLDSAAYRAVRARRPRATEGVCLVGTWGAEFATGLDGPLAGDRVVIKHSYDGFARAELAALLAAAGRDAVVVTGVATTLCVLATVAGAFEHGLYAIVPREATAASDGAGARAALHRIETSYGDVVAAALVLDAWRSLRA